MELGARFIIIAALFSLCGCGRSENVPNSLEPTNRVYSLCPKRDDARQRLLEAVRDFAERRNAQLIDRSAGAHRELSGLESKVLENTGGEPVLLTVTKPTEFRVSVTNLGLSDKMALAVRVSRKIDGSALLVDLMDGLSPYWDIQTTEGSVGNDPPCGGMQVSRL